MSSPDRGRPVFVLYVRAGITETFPVHAKAPRPPLRQRYRRRGVRLLEGGRAVLTAGKPSWYLQATLLRFWLSKRPGCRK